MKSLNLNLKPVCCQCNIAKGRKKARLETEHQELSEDEENDKETVEEADDSDESEEDLAIGTGTKKRKRSGENHTHCHCSLFQVTDGLINFMSAGQPYQRFKTDQIKRKDSVKVDRLLLLQKRKQDKNKYKMDLKKESVRFKQALRLSQKEKVTDDDQQNKSKTPEEKREERRLRKEEIERKRKAVKEYLPLLFD